MPLDVSMPRNLVRRRRHLGYAAICAVGFEADPLTFRLATAEDTENHLSLIQRGTWHDLHFVRLQWTAGAAVARTIVGRAERFLTETSYALGHHWFRCDPSILDDRITTEAANLNAQTWTHTQLIERLKHQLDAEADRFARGAF